MLATLWGWLKEIGDSIYDAVAGLISWLGSVFPWLLDSLGTLLEWVLDAVWYLIKAIPYLLCDGIFTAILTVTNALDLSTVAVQFAAGYGLIPSQAAYFMCMIGFPQFASMIAAAYVVRFILNLKPTVAGTGLPQL